VARYRVLGCWRSVHRTGAETLAARYGGRPPTVQVARDLRVQAVSDRPAVATAVGRLGWRVYATNVPAEQLSLVQAVLAYRSHTWWQVTWSAERAPLVVDAAVPGAGRPCDRLDPTVVGGWRVLTLLECVVRQRLAAARTVLIGRIPATRSGRRPAPRPNVCSNALRADPDDHPGRSSPAVSSDTPLRVQRRILTLLKFRWTSI